MSTVKRSMKFFGNASRLARHLGVSASTVRRWLDDESKTPQPVRLLLLGYLEHPERLGEDLAMMEEEE